VTNSLNSNHERRLTVTCRHIDKLLAEIESALNISTSGLAFPQYDLDLSKEQCRVLGEYIVRIRAHLVRTLEGQEIEPPVADIPVSRALYSYLTFLDIAAEELKPRYMRGYGEVPEAAAVELSRISNELQELMKQLRQYLNRCTTETERNKASC
jgi:hypothetical protein